MAYAVPSRMETVPLGPLGWGNEAGGQPLSSSWSPNHQHELRVLPRLREGAPTLPTLPTAEHSGTLACTQRNLVLKLETVVQISLIQSLRRWFIHTQFSLEEGLCKWWS